MYLNSAATFLLGIKIIMKHLNKLLIAIIGSATILLPIADACTRLTYDGQDGNVFTGRTLDYDRAFNHDLWVLPAGLERSGQAGGNASQPFAKGSKDVKWTSKYGSVVAVMAGCPLDGMNDHGLSMSLTLDNYATYSKYQTKASDNLSVFFSGQYVLDNFTTVNEAITGLEKLNIVGVPVKMANGMPFSGIMTLTDASGDNAVFEWKDGHLKVYHGKEYNVTANEGLSHNVDYGDMQKVRQYYRGLNTMSKNNITVALPGTYSSEDRIARVGYYLDNVPKESDPILARMWTFALIRGIATSMPFADGTGVTTNTTGWLSVADLKNKRYYIDVPELLSPYYIAFNELDLKPGAQIRKLPIVRSSDLSKRETVVPHSGDISNTFEISKPDPTWLVENYK